MQEVIEEVHLISQKVNGMKNKCAKIYRDIDGRLQEESRTSELQILIDDITYLDRASSYLQFVSFIEDLR